MKNPIDLSTIKRKLDTGQYQEPWQYVDDVWLMFNNAWLYNRKTSRVYKYCTKLAEVFEAEIDPVMQGLGYCCGRKVRWELKTKTGFISSLHIYVYLYVGSNNDMDFKCLSDVSTVRVFTPDTVLLWQTVVYHLPGWHLLQLPEQVKCLLTLSRNRKGYKGGWAVSERSHTSQQSLI